jgi:ferredoxin-NADP reductase
MSDYLTSKLAIGDSIKCTAPLGHLGKESKSDTYLLISTGSGLTPIYSLYQTLMTNDKYTKIAHIFGERHQDYLIDNITSSRQETEKTKHYLHLSQDTKTDRKP